MRDPVLLELTKVSKINGSRLLFRNLDLCLRAGESSLLTGSNGAGKSTLLKIIAGLAHPTTGSVKRKEGLRLSYLGHATFLYPGLTAIENLSFWQKAAWPDLELKLEEALDGVGLLPYAHEYAGNFSRGMAQRLNFARALLASPELLLLDEPFTGIDEHSRQMIVKELRRRQNDGAGILMVTHDPGADRALATTEYMLEQKGLKNAHVFSEENSAYGAGTAAC